MFMHMPKKWGVPVLVAVALALGAYYWLVLASEHVGDWEIYQGTGRMVPRSDSSGEHVDISYTVTRPAKPLFRRLHLKKAVPPDNRGIVVVNFTYRTEWPTTLRLVVYDEAGVAYEARATLVHADDAQTLNLGPSDFAPCQGTALPGRQTQIDLGRIRGWIDFYDGSGVKNPSTRFSNRIQLENVGVCWLESVTLP